MWASYIVYGKLATDAVGRTTRGQPYKGLVETPHQPRTQTNREPINQRHHQNHYIITNNSFNNNKNSSNNDNDNNNNNDHNNNQAQTKRFHAVVDEVLHTQ